MPRRTFGIGDTAVLTILLGCFLFFELYIVKKNICRAVKKLPWKHYFIMKNMLVMIFLETSRDLLHLIRSLTRQVIYHEFFTSVSMNM